jgi:hypothetical protein
MPQDDVICSIIVSSKSHDVTTTSVVSQNRYGGGTMLNHCYGHQRAAITTSRDKTRWVGTSMVQAWPCSHVARSGADTGDTVNGPTLAVQSWCDIRGGYRAHRQWTNHGRAVMMQDQGRIRGTPSMDQAWPCSHGERSGVDTGDT